MRGYELVAASSFRTVEEGLSPGSGITDQTPPNNRRGVGTLRPVSAAQRKTPSRELPSRGRRRIDTGCKLPLVCRNRPASAVVLQKSSASVPLALCHEAGAVFGQKPPFSKTLSHGVVSMKQYSISRLGLSRRVGRAVFGVALTIGMVVGCGDDDNGFSGPGVGSDAAVTSAPDAGASTSDEPGETGQVADGSTPDPRETSGETIDSGSDDAGGDAGATGTSDDCGGAGEPCCAEMACNGGFICNVLDIEPDLVGLDGGWGFSDAGTVLDGSLDLPAGICAPCGGEGEVCCAENACNDGFSCETLQLPFEVNSCVANPVAVVDGGLDAATGESCGGEGQNCCQGRGMGGVCDDGLDCDNPGTPDLADSECVDSGGDVQTDSGSECGGLDQPCCEGRRGNGVCNDELECDGNPPRGLEGDVCVEP